HQGWVRTEDSGRPRRPAGRRGLPLCVRCPDQLRYLRTAGLSGGEGDPATAGEEEQAATDRQLHHRAERDQAGGDTGDRQLTTLALSVAVQLSGLLVEGEGERAFLALHELTVQGHAGGEREPAAVLQPEADRVATARERPDDHRVGLVRLVVVVDAGVLVDDRLHGAVLGEAVGEAGGGPVGDRGVGGQLHDRLSVTVVVHDEHQLVAGEERDDGRQRRRLLLHRRRRRLAVSQVDGRGLGL